MTVSRRLPRNSALATFSRISISNVRRSENSASPRLAQLSRTRSWCWLMSQPAPLDSKSSKMLLEQFERLNEKFQTTILMVTHDAFAASYANRVIFIKDGKVFNELRKGDDTRKKTSSTRLLMSLLCLAAMPATFYKTNLADQQKGNYVYKTRPQKYSP